MAIILNEFVDIKDLNTMIESVEGSSEPNYWLKGPFLCAEDRNKNGRWYTMDICNREVKKFNEEKISQNRALGQLEHVKDPYIHLERVSHMITSLIMQGKFGMGEAKFLDTPLGKIGKALVKDKVILGVSTRGIGTADNETGRVNDDYSLVTVDCVYDPSATGTLVESIVEGSEKWLFDNKTGEWVEKAVSNMKSQVAKKYDSKVAAKVFNEFIETLKNGYVK